jgi:hypothetical protein
MRGLAVLGRILGRLGAGCVLAGALTAAVAPSALAADPGRWVETGRKTTSVAYWQGITFDAGARTFYFDGVDTGLYRTSESLARTGGVGNVIPPGVRSAEGYNHLGDLSFDAAEGGRLLLPLECYYPGQPNGGNTCQTGSIAAADPGTLAWRYYVKLDPAYIKKAMWVEASPDGRWIWTSSGTSLLAYNAADITPANAAPAGPRLVPRRLTGVLPASGVSGATFLGGRLFVALNRGTYFEVVSYAIDTSGSSPVLVDGPRREIERTKSSSLYESEGLATANALNGELHWQIHPQVPFYGRIISFRPAG